MSLAERLAEDLKSAQKQGEQLRLSTLRMLKSELKYKEIEKGQPLSEEDEIQVLSASAKKREDSIAQFKQGERADLAAKEEAELKIVRSYLPKQLNQEELERLIDEAIAEVQAKGKSDLGRVMKSLMPKVKGRADGRLVNQIVTARLETSGATS